MLFLFAIHKGRAWLEKRAGSVGTPGSVNHRQRQKAANQAPTKRELYRRADQWVCAQRSTSGQAVREKDVLARHPWKDVLWLSETKAQELSLVTNIKLL